MRKIILMSLSSLVFILAVPTLALTAPPSLQEKFTQSQSGDYIVTAQEGNYSVLFIRSITAETLLLEEIAIPENLIDLKKADWKKWVMDKAPGHTSWTLYEIDRKSGTLVECFSYSKNGWLYLDESEQLLTRLLSLRLSPVAESERKKIGQPPANGEADRRSVWTPPLVVEGVKAHKPEFEVLKTQWPDDDSRLSLCSIELYFAKEMPAFPFPFWMEVHSPHYTFKMRGIDSGHQLISPMTGPMPHRSPQIVGTAQKGQDIWKVTLHSPAYFQKMHLFVLDITGDCKATIPIAFTCKNGAKKEELVLEINTPELKRNLQSGHRYQWVVVPEGSADIYVESEEVFTWL
jgi:hypothetical protein